MRASSGIETPENSDQTLPIKPWRAPLLWLLIPVIIGYLVDRSYSLQNPRGILLLSLLIIAVSLATARFRIWPLVFPFGVTLLAWVWADQRAIDLPEIWNALPPREAILEGQVTQTYSGTMYPESAYAIIRIKSAPRLMPELHGQKAFASVSQDTQEIPLRKNARIQLKGVLFPATTDNEEFSDFLESRDIRFQLRQGRILLETKPPPTAISWLSSLRKDWAGWLHDSPTAHANASGLLAAMILGEREFLTSAQEETFLAAGAMHLFAVSGLHVMIVGLTMDQLLKLLRISFFTRRIISLCFVGLYVSVIDFSPSALRAFSILAFYVLSTLLPRPAKPIPVVLASALVTLIISPSQLYSIGFQLSYSVVIAILTFGLPLKDCFLQRWPGYRLSLETDLTALQKSLRWGRRKTIESLCISFAATLGSAPLIILHFQLWTPGAIVLNALLVPIATLVVGAGVLIILLHSFGLGPLSIVFAYPAWILIRLMEKTSVYATAIPGFYTDLSWDRDDFAHLALVSFLLLLLATPTRLSVYAKTACFGGISIYLLSVILIGTTPF